jgi:NAD(P)-dependent dehydrogenase (short-subunit alcohol dehydrogenase family)
MSKQVVLITGALSGIGRATAIAFANEDAQIVVSGQSAALEAAPFGVRVNAVAPGPVQTPMLERSAPDDDGKKYFASLVPLKRIGTPEEIADTVLFVASAKASFITGQSFSADGGQTVG